MNCTVKRLYADGGTEFINHTLKEYCEKEGILLKYPPAGTQQLNGIAENSVKWIKNTMLTMLIHAKLPDRYWSRACTHATYLWNRTAVSPHTGMTPYEAMYKKKPSAKHWATFGCDAYAHVPKQHRGALVRRKGEPCIYLGHDDVQNSSVVAPITEPDRRLITRDLQCHNNSFTFGAAVGQGNVHWMLDGDRIPSGPSAVQGGRLAPAVQAESDDVAADGMEYEVERIIAQRRNADGVLEYKVHWAGYDHDADTWEPADMMQEDAPRPVKEFKDRQAAAAAAAVPAAAEVAIDHEAAAAPPAVVAPAAVVAVVPAVPAPVLPGAAAPVQRRSKRSTRTGPYAAMSKLDTVDEDRDCDDEDAASLTADDPRVQMIMSAIMADCTGAQERTLALDAEQVVYAIKAGLQAKAKLQSPNILNPPLTYKGATSGVDGALWSKACDKGDGQLYRDACMGLGATGVHPS